MFGPLWRKFGGGRGLQGEGGSREGRPSDSCITGSCTEEGTGERPEKGKGGERWGQLERVERRATSEREGQEEGIWSEKEGTGGGRQGRQEDRTRGKGKWKMQAERKLALPTWPARCPHPSRRPGPESSSPQRCPSLLATETSGSKISTPHHHYPSFLDPACFQKAQTYFMRE